MYPSLAGQQGAPSINQCVRQHSIVIMSRRSRSAVVSVTPVASRNITRRTQGQAGSNVAAAGSFQVNVSVEAMSALHTEHAAYSGEFSTGVLRTSALERTTPMRRYALRVCVVNGDR